MLKSRLLPLVACLLILAGCGPATFSSDVSRFNSGLPAGDGRTTFTILPDEQQRGSLEFESYAQEVASQMALRGYRPVPASERADLIVQFRYGTRGEHTVVETTPSTTVGVGFGHGGYRHRGWGWGSGLSTPLYTDTRTTTYYTHFLDLNIYPRDAFKLGNAIRLFEGHVLADSQSQTQARTIPYMIRALFDGFPGRNGETARISVPLDPY